MNNIDVELIASFRETLDEQVRNTLARRIRGKVRDARSDPDHAARRWPFELVQNAHDAGPRAGREGISLQLDLVDRLLRFSHDAAPFTMGDIAALITGGSSKDFDAPDTTGRFGTGFLVTHVLSERVHVIGLLEKDGQCRRFNVSLYRPDDEDLILQNINDSESTLGHTEQIADADDLPTAVLEYRVDDTSAASVGIKALEGALPHLFGTCRRLRHITIRCDDSEQEWIVTSNTPAAVRNGVVIEETIVSSTTNASATREWRVIRASEQTGARGHLVVALRKRDEGWELSKPEAVASVFRQLPLLGSPMLPGWVIIDGDFDVDEIRSSVHVSGGRDAVLREAFAAIGGLAMFATEEAWTNGYRIAQLAMPTESLGEDATKIWREILESAATELSQLPLVQTVREGLLPSVETEDRDHHVDFISQQPSVGYDDFWKLCAECTKVDPPVVIESEGWSEIAQGWQDLGVTVTWIDLKRLGELASSEAAQLCQIHVAAEQYDWLARYLDAVGKAWEASGVVKSHLTHLLPDQNGRLRNPSELRKDGGVDARLKAIAANMALDIKAQLLDEKLITALEQDNLEFGLNALAEVSGDQMDRDEVLDTLVQHLVDSLPADQPVETKHENLAAATLDIFEYLWTSRGDEARELAWKVPLLAADGTSRRAGQRRLMVPPVLSWPETARRFADAYPPGRVLADIYATVPSAETLLKALSRWGMCHQGLISNSKREELRDRGLRAIAANPDEVGSGVLREPQFSQIALLEPEIINHCKQSRELTRQLVGFLLCYVAREDQSWRSTVVVSLRTSDGDKPLELTPSLWLSDLRSKPWIPVEEDDEVTHHAPNAELMRELIDSAWLEGNKDGADLLVQHFGLDALEASLLTASSNDQVRHELRQSLAKMVEVAGSNPQLINDLVTKAVKLQHDVNRMRRLGLAVQERVKAALESRHLKVDAIDYGYDYLVTNVHVREGETDDLSAYFEVGQFKVEVKTTTIGEVRLTPLQALTSTTEREWFVLCVVDLRLFPGDIDTVDWVSEDVSLYCRFLSGTVLPVNDTLMIVRSAEASAIPARNTGALRYGVHSDLWQCGFMLDEWIESAF